MDAMTENLGAINAAVSLLIKAALLAARFSGRVRRRSLKRLAAMDTDAKAKEILFLKDRVCQLEPSNIERHIFAETRLTAYHLKQTGDEKLADRGGSGGKNSKSDADHN